MERLIDVRELEPCEPLERTLAAVDALAAGDFLHVIHRREPHLLFPLLRERNLAWRLSHSAEGRYDIYIYRSDDTESGNRVREACDGAC